MPKTVLEQLHDQLEAVRREAFAEGYAAALQSVRDFLSRSTAPATTPPATGRAPARERPAKARRPARPAHPRAALQKPPRGNNPKLVEEALRAFAPGGARPGEIRKFLRREKGIELPFSSIGHALRQLHAHGSVEHHADSGSWRALPRGEEAKG